MSDKCLVCPWCMRHVPQLVGVANVFGNRFRACSRPLCQSSVRATADVYRDSQLAAAEGKIAVNGFITKAYGEGFTIIMPPKLEEQYADDLHEAARKVINPWFQTRRDREAHLYLADLLREMAKDTDVTP